MYLQLDSPVIVSVADLLGNPIKYVMYTLDCFIVDSRGEMPFVYYRHIISYFIIALQLVVLLIGFWIIKIIIMKFQLNSLNCF